MAHPYHHAVSSAKQFGGQAEEYQKIHDWFDASKSLMTLPHHRMLRHHSFGIFECEAVFGTTIKLSTGKEIPLRWIGEQHVREDLGYIPSFEEWVVAVARGGLDKQGRPVPEPWMHARAQKLSKDLTEPIKTSIEQTVHAWQGIGP